MGAFFWGCAETDVRISGKKAYINDVVITESGLNFDVQTLSYSLSFTTNKIGLTASTFEQGTLVINGQTNSAVTSASNLLDLAEGMNVIEVVVEREGYQSTTYTFNMVYYNPMKDARLETLAFSAGTLEPAEFDPNVTNYTLTVNAVAFDVTATTFVTNPSFTIDGSGATSGVAVTVDSMTNATNYLPIVVTSGDGSVVRTYGIVIDFQYTPVYTNQNYDFIGGIDDFRTQIEANPDGYTNNNTVLTGVVTLVDGYVDSGGKKSVFLQDQTGAIALYSSSSIAGIEPGDKIKITVNVGRVRYSFPQIHDFDAGSVEVISKYNPIYYKAVDNTSSPGYAQNSEKCFFYQYTGTVTGEMDNYGVGTFSGNMKFHTDKYADWASDVEVGDSGVFYGPIVYSYNAYKLEIVNSYQIKQQ